LSQILNTLLLIKSISAFLERIAFYTCDSSPGNARRIFFTMIAFQKIAVLAGGLLGGSIALAGAGSHRIVVWSRRPEATAQAFAMGIEATSDLSVAVRDADLLILCVPVGSMAGLLQHAIDAGLSSDCLITDVGSVKRLPHESLRPLLAKVGLRFIGSHPMAGGEKGGIEQARVDLFQNAACLLTNDEAVAKEECEAIEQFWQSLGCRTAWTDATEHDAIVARVSHFPHLLACVGAMVGLKNPALGQYGGGGLRDTTRVASGSPTMWAEILRENRDELLRVVRESQSELEVIANLLDSGDLLPVEAWLQEAKCRRDKIRLES
jgi:prephenate dehydrogenase